METMTINLAIVQTPKLFCREGGSRIVETNGLVKLHFLGTAQRY